MTNNISIKHLPPLHQESMEDVYSTETAPIYNNHIQIPR